MRHFSIATPDVQQDHYRRMRECIRRRSVLGPWKKIYLERLRARRDARQPATPEKMTPEKAPKQASPQDKPTLPATVRVDTALQDKEKEIEDLEAKLRELMDRKHVQFGLLKAILMDEARQKMTSRLMAAPTPSPV
ncbi:hypothetical protein ACHHYP_03124 [Achlya hypogyna]|uniref:Uncharacterized protein n=1 Tax=Achlya hypogyna TaxID=1202772 RepID=A0A1V9Z4D1_ACHHY|nr:hypothetical protein ACHHYP_03124 [Achlya hypogyna]